MVGTEKKFTSVHIIASSVAALAITVPIAGSCYDAHQKTIAHKPPTKRFYQRVMARNEELDAKLRSPEFAYNPDLMDFVHSEALGFCDVRYVGCKKEVGITPNIEQISGMRRIFSQQEPTNQDLTELDGVNRRIERAIKRAQPPILSSEARPPEKITVAGLGR